MRTLMIPTLSLIALGALPANAQDTGEIPPTEEIQPEAVPPTDYGEAEPPAEDEMAPPPEASAEPAGPNIVEAAQAAGQFATLVAAIDAAGLTAALSQGGPFTVFAPTDEAFAKLPEGQVDTLLQPENREQLVGLLSYHVVQGAVTAADLQAAAEQNGGSATIPTAQGGELTVTLADGALSLADAQGNAIGIISADLVQSNGIIHAVDTVLTP